jgi:molybdopterin-guanine dinucleotide biosynthesis protein A
VVQTPNENSPWPHTGAILAGGGSVRMGEPKESITLPDGRTMLDAVAAALGAVCARLVVVGTTDARPDLAHIADLRPDAGPLGGIESLLASDLDTEYLVCPCDLPLITAPLLRTLANAPPAPMTILRVPGDERTHALPARLAAAALPAVRELLDSGRRAVQQLVRAVAATEIEIPPAAARHLHNVNTPEDLEATRGDDRD